MLVHSPSTSPLKCKIVHRTLYQKSQCEKHVKIPKTNSNKIFVSIYIWRSWQRAEVHAVCWSMQCKFHIQHHGFPALLYLIPDQNVQNSYAVSALSAASLTKGSLYASDILGWITSLKMIYYFQTALLRIEPNISEWGCPSSSASSRKRNTFYCINFDKSM